MALSNSVEKSLEEAQAHLRNALAFAARQERPIVCTQISKLLADIERIGSFDELLDTLDNTLNEKVKITPETYQKMEDEFREEGLAFTITIPTQEAIDKWQNAAPIPQPVRHNVDMVAEMWNKHREQPEEGPEADRIAGMDLIKRAGGLLNAQVEYLDNKIVITYG